MATPTTTSRPRRYTVEELLFLRSSLPVVNCVVRKLNKHPDIAGIFRIPEEALNDPDRYYCQSQALVDVTNRRKVLQLGSRHTGTSTGESEEKVIFSAKLTNHSRPQQWHLRRRDTSNRSSEPHPAPSGIASQQSENFQRFYRAVVSPTHVRVTAGGRIVPNTRATAPPQFNWNPEKCLFEPRRPFADIEQNTPQAPTSWLPNSQAVVASPLQPALMPSYNFLPQSASLAQATMAAQSLHSLQSSSENGQPHKEAANDPLQPTNLQQPIKISPPSQFDHSRPFMFNGQLVYPVPAGFQPPPNSVPLPISVLGDPNLPHQVPLAGNFLPTSYPMPYAMSGFANPFMISPGSGHFPMMLPNGLPMIDGSFHPPPYLPQPAPGMVSLSELTKFQIQGFHNQVKNLDYQMASNQHLANDPFFHRQRSELMSFIEKMEATLQVQLGQEVNQFSLTNLNGSTLVANSASTGSSSTETLATEESSSSKGDNNNGPQRNKLIKHKDSIMASPAVVPPIPLFVPNTQAQGKQDKPEETQVRKASLDSKLMTKSEPAITSRLTAAAARAPPFQPRAHTLERRSGSDPDSDTPTQSSAPSVISSVPTQGLLTPLYVGTRRDTTSSSDWDQFPSGLGHESLSRAHSMQVSHFTDGNHSGLLQRSSAFHTMSAVQEAAAFEAAGKGPSISPIAEPYLVGELPNGMHISEANGSDFEYARPLTEQELRARHLYWGDVPRSAMKGWGLPKFDGKDFYPPSPTKSITTPATISHAKHKSTSVALPDFEQLFNEPGMPGCQTPRQVQAKSGEHDFKPSPTQVFLENGIIGFQSPSPRPATYKFENKLPLNWSPTKYGSRGNSAQKKTTQLAFSAATNPVTDDFSTLFISPTALRHCQSFRHGANAQPATPTNKALSDSVDDDGYETKTLDSWGAPKAIVKWNAEGVDDAASNKSNGVDSPSNGSTVEIRLTSKVDDGSPKRGFGRNFAERVNNIQSGDQHTLFLQNMLRNAAATKAAPALSGAVSSATAQGYLPQYRGSAAASLAPAMFTTSTLEREDESASISVDHMVTTENGIRVSMEGVVPLIAANFLPENRPINRDRPRRPILASVESLGAEGYMRYLAQKAENDKKILEQGWNANTTGTGPVMGSDW